MPGAERDEDARQRGRSIKDQKNKMDEKQSDSTLREARAPRAFEVSFAPLAGSRRDCEACARGEGVGFDFDYAFQPIVDMETRQVWAQEALVRGPNGEGAGSVLAQVTEANRYRFDQACRVKAIEGAVRLGLSEKVSINFLPNAIYKPELCIRTTLAAAKKHGMPLSQIIFEVTEGERVEDGPWFAEILKEYKRCGFMTAIDDFGAGYAGMKLLADFQPDVIKIDMDLIRGIERSQARRAIVRSIMSMSEEMSIQVVAEGIETAAERDELRRLGVRWMQGYAIARPAFKARARLEPGAFEGVQGSQRS